MARPLRVEFDGASYHVTSRGNAREDIFDEDGDRKAFLEILGKVVNRFNWLCHAYCLMDNHYHLVIETPEANLSKGMRQLNGIYTQVYNRRHRSVGHVFQGRTKPSLFKRRATFWRFVATSSSIRSEPKPQRESSNGSGAVTGSLPGLEKALPG